MTSSQLLILSSALVKQATAQDPNPMLIARQGAPQPDATTEQPPHLSLSRALTSMGMGAGSGAIGVTSAGAGAGIGQALHRMSPRNLDFPTPNGVGEKIQALLRGAGEGVKAMWERVNWKVRGWDKRVLSLKCGD